MTGKVYKIAVILTCHNRKNKTVSSLETVFIAQDNYNSIGDDKVELVFFLTDDGCTDGTPEAINDRFSEKRINIIKGTGELYWAGGMRTAWNEAYKQHKEWDFYLLMNDDTLFESNAFELLLKTHNYSLETHGISGVYVGTCCSNDRHELTYGGISYSFPIIGRFKVVHTEGMSCQCQMTCANILLVSKTVVEKVGLLCEDYQHCCADWAYGIEANHRGFPVLTTSSVCGLCDNDHDTEQIEKSKILAMTIKERRDFFNHPLRSTADKMKFMRKYQKVKYMLVYLARELNIYLPSIYYYLSSMRPGTNK